MSSRKTNREKLNVLKNTLKCTICNEWFSLLMVEPLHCTYLCYDREGDLTTGTEKWKDIILKSAGIEKQKLIKEFWLKHKEHFQTKHSELYMDFK